MISPVFACFRDNVRVFPICLELPDSLFGGVFENFPNDKCSDLEDSGPCLVVVMSNRPLLVGGHPDGCIFSYLIHLV